MTPAVSEAMLVEQSIEQAPVMPSPLARSVVAPEPPAPKRVTRVSELWPPSRTSNDVARPMSELARTSSGSAAREVAFAMEIPFAPGAPRLGSEAREQLDALAARLNWNDAPYVLEVQGHADANGNDAANFLIALERAEAVRRYVIAAAGLSAPRVAVVSLGSGRPIADNATATGRAANRRATVLVLR